MFYVFNSNVFNYYGRSNSIDLSHMRWIKTVSVL